MAYTEYIHECSRAKLADTLKPKRFLTVKVSIACSEATHRSKWNESSLCYEQRMKKELHERIIEKKRKNTHSIETLVPIVADKQCACETLCPNIMSEKKIDYQIK